MKRAFIRFVLWVTLSALALVVSVIFGEPLGGAAVLLVFVPICFMAWVDLGRALRRWENASYLGGVLVGIPQALIALAALGGGILLASSSFWATGHASWWMFVIGAAMCPFGIYWIRDALKKGQ